MNRTKLSVFVLLVMVVAAWYTVATGESGAKSKSFDVQKGGNLFVDIQNIGADVEVKIWAKNEVTVRVEGISDRDLEWLEIDKSGNTVNVVFDADNGWRRHRSARFYINAPSEFNLDIGTSGGDVDVIGAVQGTVDAKTAGGDVEVGDVVGRVVLKTAGGSVTAGDVDGDADLTTAGGDVKIGRVTGEFNAKTAGGDIEAGEVKRDLNATTAGGDISCRDVGGEVVAKTSGGDIVLGVVGGGVVARTAGGDIEARGATGRVTAKTAGGNVDLSSVKGYVDVSTAGGDITVELDPTNASGSDMETAGGDIVLILPADADATIEALINLRDRGRDRDWDRGVDEYDIRSDFKAEKHDRDRREVRARYVINGGGKLIRMETTNGNIEIRKK